MSVKVKETSNGMLSFQCPGCESRHVVNLQQGKGPVWSWNGSPESPTLSPSVLVTSGHYVPGHQGDCWCDYLRDHPDEADCIFGCSICHSFVRDGRIEFLNDCTHALKGQTVDLPDLE